MLNRLDEIQGNDRRRQRQHRKAVQIKGLHFEGKIKVCKLNVESEKVDKQNCKQDKHRQKDNENITAF